MNEELDELEELEICFVCNREMLELDHRPSDQHFRFFWCRACGSVTLEGDTTAMRFKSDLVDISRSMVDLIGKFV